MKKKFGFFAAVFIVAALLIAVFYKWPLTSSKVKNRIEGDSSLVQAQEEYPTQKRQKSHRLNKSMTTRIRPDTLQKLNDICGNKEIVPLHKRMDSVQQKLAHNIHFRKDGHIFRLRTFLQDTPEGSFEKLVFYKEDENGFAQYQKVPQEHERNPSRKIIKSYLQGGQIIHQERDLRLSFGDKEMIYSTVNGNVVKVVSSDFNCYFDKP